MFTHFCLTGGCRDNAEDEGSGFKCDREMTEGHEEKMLLLEEQAETESGVSREGRQPIDTTGACTSHAAYSTSLFG